MKISTTYIGIAIEHRAYYGRVVDEYNKLINLNPQGISKAIIDQQRVNVLPNGVRRLLFSEKVIEQFSKVKVDANFDYRLLQSLPNRKDTYITGKTKCVRYMKEGNLITGIIFDIRKKFEEDFLVWTGFGIDCITGQLHYASEEMKQDDFAFFVNEFLKPLIYTELSAVETRVIENNTSYGTKKNGKVRNESGIRITLVDTSWNVESIRITGFMVNGHYRLQRCGKNWSGVILKWIEAFEKKGYVRKAKKEIVNQ